MANKLGGKSYTAPPIIEAVIEFQFATPMADSEFEKVGKRFKRTYPNLTDGRNVELNFNLDAQRADFSAKPRHRYSSSDEADIAVLQQSSISWSRLAPYLGWDKFCERVRADAEEAYKLLSVKKLIRLGVRYINRLDIPLSDGIARYEDYLAINIDLPKHIEIIDNYAWRFEREIRDKKLRAIVQSAIVEPEIPGTAAFILDVDIIAQKDLPMRLEDVFHKLGEMRQVKNEYFELSIRDSARRLFEQ